MIQLTRVLCVQHLFFCWAHNPSDQRSHFSDLIFPQTKRIELIFPRGVLISSPSPLCPLPSASIWACYFSQSAPEIQRTLYLSFSSPQACKLNVSNYIEHFLSHHGLNSCSLTFFSLTSFPPPLPLFSCWHQSPTCLPPSVTDRMAMPVLIRACMARCSARLSAGLWERELLILASGDGLKTTGAKTSKQSLITPAHWVRPHMRTSQLLCMRIKQKHARVQHRIWYLNMFILDPFHIDFIVIHWWITW